MYHSAFELKHRYLSHFLFNLNAIKTPSNLWLTRTCREREVLTPLPSWSIAFPLKKYDLNTSTVSIDCSQFQEYPYGSREFSLNIEVSIVLLPFRFLGKCWGFMPKKASVFDKVKQVSQTCVKHGSNVYWRRRKNKYASLYNHSTFVVASIYSLVFDTTSKSAYVTKNIESQCPIVLLVSSVEQLWSWSIYVLRSRFCVVT